MKIDWEQGATMIPIGITGNSTSHARKCEGTLRRCKEVAASWPPDIQFTVYLNLPGIDGKTTVNRAELEAMNFD
jgi:hypothetical protein